MNLNINNLLVAGHQPNFFPWFGYFEKVLKCDLFVHSDDVQYPKQSYTNRVEIPVSNSSTYLNLPVSKGSGEIIAAKKFVKNDIIINKIKKTISINFKKFPYYEDVEPVMLEFEKIYEKYETIADLNIQMNQFIALYMGIDTPTKRGTELGLELYAGNNRLIERCHILRSRNYLCGNGADDYQDENLIRRAGIEIIRINYDLGKSLFGEDMRYSIIHGIAKIGIYRIQEAVSVYKDMKKSI